MKRLLLLTILLFGCLPINLSYADTKQTVKVLKITVERSNSDSFYAFISPNHYYYRQGHQEISGANAVNQVEKVENALHLTANTTAEELVNRLKSVVGDDLTGYQIRWVDQEGHLYTWVWSESN